MDVPTFLQQLSIQLEQLLFGAGGRWGDARVCNLLAPDGLAFARDDLRVLQIDVMRARCFGGVLVGGYAQHDGGCVRACWDVRLCGLSVGSLGKESQREQECEQRHG